VIILFGDCLKFVIRQNEEIDIIALDDESNTAYFG